MVTKKVGGAAHYFEELGFYGITYGGVIFYRNKHNKWFKFYLKNGVWETNVKKFSYTLTVAIYRQIEEVRGNRNIKEMNECL